MNPPEPYEWRLRPLSFESWGTSCDWGECSGDACLERFDYETGQWLNVCLPHIFGGQP